MTRRVAIGMMTAAGLLGLAPAAFAQGCAICRTIAEAQGPAGAKALNQAIFILLIPTALFFIGILLWAFVFRNRGWQEESTADDRAALVLSPRALLSTFLRAAGKPSARASSNYRLSAPRAR